MTMMRLMLLLPLLAAAPYYYYGVVSFSLLPSQPSPAQYNDRNRRWWLLSRETTNNRRQRPPTTTPLLLLWQQQNNDEVEDEDDEERNSDLRRKLFLLPIAVVGAYGYGNLLGKALSGVRGIEYPASHESRVASTIATAITAAAADADASTTTASSSSSATYDAAAAAATTAANNKSRHRRPSSVLRFLEVGIGTEARLLRRGLYDPALQQLAAANNNNNNNFAKKVELTGVDVRIPDSKNTAASVVVQREVNQKLAQLQDRTGIDTDLQWVEGSITDGLPQYSDGYFDCIVCCLTLCSVEAPVTAALQEMKRLLRVDGGTFGYVEHVAVEPDDQQQHRFLEWQQTTFDPWQQKLADNCHLHRYTERDIQDVFVVSNNDDDDDGPTNTGSSSSSSKYLQQERFYVDSMWPVSCQCCGVVQRSDCSRLVLTEQK